MKKLTISVSSSTVSLSNKTMHRERAIAQVFQAVKKYTRFKRITDIRFRNGVFRYDIELMYNMVARFIIDPYARVPDTLLIGYYDDDKKFEAITHQDYPIHTIRDDFKGEAKKLQAELLKLVYRYRKRTQF